jgi:hypothetical protein
MGNAFPAAAPHVVIAINPSHEYDLPELIDVALKNNPETLRTWSAARSAVVIIQGDS